MSDTIAFIGSIAIAGRRGALPKPVRGCTCRRFGYPEFRTAIYEPQEQRYV